MNDSSLPGLEQVRLCRKESPEALLNLVTWIYEAYVLVPYAFLIIFQIYYFAFIISLIQFTCKCLVGRENVSLLKV